MKLTHLAAEVEQADIDALRAHGLDDAAISDAIQVVGYFNYVTRVADGVGYRGRARVELVLAERGRHATLLRSSEPDRCLPREGEPEDRRQQRPWRQFTVTTDPPPGNGASESQPWSPIAIGVACLAARCRDQLTKAFASAARRKNPRR